MMSSVKLSTILVCGLFLSVSSDDAATKSIVSGVNCSSTDSLVRGFRQCLDTYSIPLTIPADHQNSSFLTSFYQQLDSAKMRTLCGPEHRENYVSATLCIFNVTMKCNPGGSTALGTDVITLRQRIEFQCQSIGEFDIDCVLKTGPAIQECAKNRSLQDPVPGIDEYPSIDAIVCRSQVASRICAKQLLIECGAATLQIYLQQLPPLPDVCMNYSDGVPVVNTGSVDCSLGPVSQSYLNCQVEAGLFVLLPQNVQSHGQIVDFTLKTVTEQGPKVCSKLAKYESLVNCTLSVEAYCTPDSEKHTLPDSDAFQEGLRNLCEHVADYNNTCITSAIASLDNKEDQTTYTLINRTLGCDVLMKKLEILFSAVGSCDEKTVSLYKDTLTLQLPVGCRLTTTTPPGINTGHRSSLPVLSLIFMLICVLIL